jgi:hypothetical protein
MRFKSFCVAAIPLIGIFEGCASSSPRGSAAPASRVGVFRFLERVPDTSPGMTLDGEITVERDTILVEATPGPCHYDELRSRGTTVVYRCATDIFLYFDRDNPIDRAQYTLVATVNVPVRTCARYTVTTDGRRVCAQVRTEMVPREVRRSGRLRPQRVQ